MRQNYQPLVLSLLSFLSLLPTCTFIYAIYTAQPAQAEETAPVFELDCINFAGRGLANSPVKKKARPGFAADGTTWAMSSDDKSGTRKVLVTKVFPGEAAEKAGVAEGDEIISVNGYPTATTPIRQLFCAYHMYEPKTMTETLVVQKKDGTQQTLKLLVQTLDKCNADEKKAWLDLYKVLGY